MSASSPISGINQPFFILLSSAVAPSCSVGSVACMCCMPFSTSVTLTNGLLLSFLVYALFFELELLGTLRLSNPGNSDVFTSGRMASLPFTGVIPMVTCAWVPGLWTEI